MVEGEGVWLVGEELIYQFISLKPIKDRRQKKKKKRHNDDDELRERSRSFFYIYVVPYMSIILP